MLLDKSNPLDWWPEKTLARHPVQEVFVCGRQIHPPPLSHLVNFPRLEIPLKGVYENQLDQEGRITTVRLHPGTALFAAPNCWNLPTWRHRTEILAILFGKKKLGISLVSSSGTGTPQLQAGKFCVPEPVSGPVPHLLNTLLELQTTDGPQAAFPGVIAALLLCVQWLVQEAPAPGPESRAQGLFDRICLHLQSHYHDGITRDSVAREFGMSPNHLSRLFHSHGHMTFINYLTHVRIDRAKFLLCKYDGKMDDIASRCGFNDGPYFCRVFKRLTKRTPTDYRAAMLQGMAQRE